MATITSNGIKFTILTLADRPTGKAHENSVKFSGAKDQTLRIEPRQNLIEIETDKPITVHFVSPGIEERLLSNWSGRKWLRDKAPKLNLAAGQHIIHLAPHPSQYRVICSDPAGATGHISTFTAPLPGAFAYQHKL